MNYFLSYHHGLEIFDYPYNIFVSLTFLISFIFFSLKNYKFFFPGISKSYLLLVPFAYFSIFISIVFGFLFINFYLAKYFIIFVYFFIFAYTTLNIKELKKYLKLFFKKVFKIKKTNLNDKLILIFLCIYFIISLLPITDADSLNYHYGFASILLRYKNLDFLNDVEIIDFNFFFVGFGEIINFIGLVLCLDNFGSQINFTAIILIYYFILQYYKNKNNSYIFLSIIASPLLMSMISSQKTYLLPVTLLSILFLKIYKRQVSKNEIFLLLIIIFFTVGSKINLIPFAFLCGLILMYFCHKKKYLNYFFKYLLISFIIILSPYLYKNIFFHHDLLPPFLLEITNNNSIKTSEFLKWIRSYDVKLSLYNFVMLPLIMIIPHIVDNGRVMFSYTQISKIYGIQFYNFLFVKKLDKYYLLLIFSIFTIVLLTMNISTRWFLLLFLLIQFSSLEFEQTKNSFFSFMVFIQSIFVALILIFFISFSFNNFAEGGKESFYSNLSFGYSFAQKINKLRNKYGLKEKEYILHRHRSHFWTNNHDYIINYGNDYNQLVDIKDNKIILNKMIKNKVKNKNIKIIVLGGRLENMINNFIKRECNIKIGQIFDNRPARNIFNLGKKEYTYIYFSKGDLINCILE